MAAAPRGVPFPDARDGQSTPALNFVACCGASARVGYMPLCHLVFGNSSTQGLSLLYSKDLGGNEVQTMSALNTDNYKHMECQLARDSP